MLPSWWQSHSELPVITLFQASSEAALTLVSALRLFHYLIYFRVCHTQTELLLPGGDQSLFVSGSLLLPSAMAPPSGKVPAHCWCLLLPQELVTLSFLFVFDCIPAAYGTLVLQPRIRPPGKLRLHFLKGPRNTFVKEWLRAVSPLNIYIACVDHVS